jgi:hypothetical protein
MGDPRLEVAKDQTLFALAIARHMIDFSQCLTPTSSSEKTVQAFPEFTEREREVLIYC